MINDGPQICVRPRLRSSVRLWRGHAGADTGVYKGALAYASRRPFISIRTKREPIGAYPVPLLNQHPARFE